MFSGLRKTIREFPRYFWAVVIVSFIDGIGATLLFPFFALYITQKFSVGMTQAGIVLGAFSAFGLLGNIIGGALTDRLGRRRLILFGLVFSAVSSLALGLVNDFVLLFPLAAVIGTLSDAAGPAHQAMIADILPEEKRQEGFGIMRVVRNMAWIIGPPIGGLVATKSFFALFVIDAVVSLIVAALFYVLIPETKPQPREGEKTESMVATFAGYGKVLGDKAFVGFIFASVLMGIVYIQMYSSLSVFLRDQHGVTPQGYGFILTTSAITVILFQFWTTRVIKVRPPFAILALGSLFYLIGFGLYGFVAAFPLFLAAMVIITIGEMIVMPTASALAANFAPETMRGRYMAVFSLVWAMPAIIGPTAAGYILDNYNRNYLWYAAAGLCALAALAFYFLHVRLGKQPRFAPAPAGK